MKKNKNIIFFLTIIALIVVIAIYYFSNIAMISNATNKFVADRKVSDKIDGKIYFSTLIEKEYIKFPMVVPSRYREYSYGIIKENGSCELVWISKSERYDKGFLISMEYRGVEGNIDNKNRTVSMAVSKALEGSSIYFNLELDKYISYSKSKVSDEQFTYTLKNFDGASEKWTVNITFDSSKSFNSKVENLGIPLKNKYNTEANLFSRNVWDMQVYNNRIYVGCGDYDKNTGPVPVYYYDIKTGNFVNEGSLADEQISRIFNIDGSLIITGTDPRDSWDLGNIFLWKNNSWVKYRSIPNGVHCFDITKYNGDFFVAIGTKSGTQIARSTDGAVSFKLIDMYKNGEAIDTFRTYDVFSFKGELYAIAPSGDLYKYNLSKNIFEYVESKVPLVIQYSNSSYIILDRKLQYKDKMVFINTKLFYGEELTDINLVKALDDLNCWDMKVINGSLYILCSYQNSDGKYIIYVYKTDDLEKFEEVLYFTGTSYARSFEYASGYFYFGIGAPYGGSLSDAGTILRVHVNSL